MQKDELIEDLELHIINDLYRNELAPGEMDIDAPLFDDNGLGLDSLDAVELVTIVEKNYGVVIEDVEAAKQILGSLSNLADYILANRKQS